MKKIRPYLVALFGLLLLAPGCQMIWHVFPQPKLIGFTSGADRLPLTWRNWSKGRFQSAFDTWLGQSIGLRAVGIKTDCQINYSVFRESAIKTADVPILGRNGYVYARCYVDAYARRRAWSFRDVDEYAKDLRRLQDELEKRGKAFIFMIAPSKAEIYPENIPARYLSPSTQDRRSDYQRLLPALEREGVRVIDGHALFLEWKEQDQWLLFPPGGIHWQQYAAWRIYDLMTEELESQLDRPLARVVCNGIAEDGTDWSRGEADVTRVMNIWTSPQWPQRLPRPRLSASQDPDATYPNLLLIGDSFMKGLLEIPERYKTYSRMDYYYYFGTHYAFPSGKIRHAKDEAHDWREDILSRDAVIIESNEILLDSKAWGFLEVALDALSDEPGPADAGGSSDHAF